MKQLNICRIFLQTITVANIFNTDGKSIIKQLYKGQRGNTRTSAWTWPNQGAIEKKGWEIWGRALDKSILIEKTLQLQEPLGKWIVKSPDLSQRWNVLTTNSNINLYTCNPKRDTWKKYKKEHHILKKIIYDVTTGTPSTCPKVGFKTQILSQHTKKPHCHRVRKAQSKIQNIQMES